MTLIIFLITIGVSIIAFSNHQLYQQMLFNPYMVKARNQYHRFLTSGLVHGDWIHLIINMLVFYSFGKNVEAYYQSAFGDQYIFNFLLLYIGSLVFSDIPSFMKHQNNPGFNSLGASGAVSATVFASIVFQPLSMIYIWGLLPLPAILLGVLYLVFSAYMAKKGQDNIDHDAHFYGAVYGFVFTILLQPSLGLHFLTKLGIL
ncbi:MAG: rhomboid family intramembrane serine protease [Bacteroidetes bacterium SW_10_40_5]|nr:MAG: rhomboid family intramembrane serine protease [Bacteroidetes bacterium SW_10_40_5]